MFKFSAPIVVATVAALFQLAFSTTPSASRPPASRPPDVCYEFVTTGCCPLGDRCSLNHPISPFVQRSLGSRDATVSPAGVPAAIPAPERAPSTVMAQVASASTRDRAPAKVNHIAAFFRMYPDFDYTPGNGAVHEWQRLCRFLGVDPEDNDQYLVRATRRNIRTALVRQFNHRYGEDASDLAAWQALCLVAGIAIPPTLEECEEAIRGTHVNLVDLTELEDGASITLFPTEIALSEYTKRTGKIFPRDHAEAGGLLKMLLRHIDHPRPESQISGGGRVGHRRRR